MQVDGYSLEGQKNSLKRFADREEMEVVGIYEDAGKSGKSIEGRPAFKKMLSDIKNGLEIEYILVYKLSRFGRNAADILNSLEFVQSYGINLICIEEGIVSEELWQKVHAKRFATGIKQTSRIGKERPHLLTGVLKCPLCGSSMYTNKHAWTNKDGTYKEVYYYICGRNKQERGRHCDIMSDEEKKNLITSLKKSRYIRMVKRKCR